MLASIERRSNPLTGLSAALNVTLVRRDSLSASVLDALRARLRTGQRFRPTYPLDAPLIAGDEEFTHVLPTHAYLYFWNAEYCDQTSFDYNSVFVSAVRELDYDSARVDIVTDSASGAFNRLSFTWRVSPFVLRTLRNVAVDDLGGACLRVDLGPQYMTWPKLSVRMWSEADVRIPSIYFPQGRFANIHHRLDAAGSDTHYMRVWANVPTLPTQMEAADWNRH